MYMIKSLKIPRKKRIEKKINSNKQTYDVEFAFTTTIFGANADITKPIGMAVASHLSAVCHRILENFN